MRAFENVPELLADCGRAFSDCRASAVLEERLAGTEFAPLCYWFARQSRRDPDRSFLEDYLNACVRADDQKKALTHLFSLLEENKIPFVPIKGADLAFRIYPAAALRNFGDWDIWVLPRDIHRFCDLLQRDNWQCKKDCYSDHHYGMRAKENFRVEPHFSLPNFPDAAPERLWEETRQVAGKEQQRRLSPELDLMMIFRHAMTGERGGSELLKALIDTEFLLRADPPDWEKVTALAVALRRAHPALLLAAFPEFFCGRHATGIEFTGDEISALRAYLLTPCGSDGKSSERNARSGKLFSLAWLKTQRVRLRRENLRWRYPEMGDGTWGYLRVLVPDLCRKAFILLKSRCFPDKEISAEIKLRDRFENSWKTASASSAPRRD